MTDFIHIKVNSDILTMSDGFDKLSEIKISKDKIACVKKTKSNMSIRIVFKSSKIRPIAIYCKNTDKDEVAEIDKIWQSLTEICADR